MVFWKYIFPAIFGLLIYTSLRLVNDIISGTRFWNRHWSINAIEIATALAVSYVFAAILNYFVRKYSRQNTEKPVFKTILKEFGTVFFFCALVINGTIIPMAAVTDDGLQVYDVVNINLIPSLYLLLYYAIARGNAHVKAFYDQQVKMEKIRNDQLQTELKFLKAQYHPHFLFNALNTIYFQMDENVASAKKSIEKFSELLRYQLYDQHQTVPVSVEVQYLENYIELQKTRSSSLLKINTEIDKNVLNGQHVYPLLFLPLVENAFKYVGGDYEIDIKMDAVINNIHLRVENNIPEGLQQSASAGIGLENLQRRLELLYPGKYQFSTRKEDNKFIADLSIQQL